MASVWIWIIIGALIISVGGLWRLLSRMLARPLKPDRAPASGLPGAGVVYAFTWGMMPWAKESTRLNLLAYLRGIVFHVGIGAGLVALLLALLKTDTPVVVRWLLVTGSALGALAGFGGLVARIIESRLRKLSTPDDFFSVTLVSLFLTAAAAAGIDPSWTGVFLALGAATLVAIPFTKIRHCFYFFFSRYFFGQFYGRRGVLGGARHE